MLSETGIIDKKEADKIIKGLTSIKKEIESGKFPFREEFEDIHLNIEKRLIEKIGDVGGKIHTARSRNDQIALDMRLYLRSEITEITDFLKAPLPVHCISGRRKYRRRYTVLHPPSERPAHSALAPAYGSLRDAQKGP